jgi:hypothetical protein
MAYPQITVPSANAVFRYAGIKIKHHDLGYYIAEVNGNTHTAEKLQDLVAELMAAYFHTPQQSHLISSDDEQNFAVSRNCAKGIL